MSSQDTILRPYVMKEEDKCEHNWQLIKITDDQSNRSYQYDLKRITVIWGCPNCSKHKTDRLKPIEHEDEN